MSKSKLEFFELSREIDENALIKARSVLSCVIPMSGFSDLFTDLRSFDWSEEGKKRNWWFQLQQLPTLNWAIGDWPKSEQGTKASLISFNFKVIKNWWEKNQYGNNKRLSWHDHATCIRCYNLFLWVEFCRKNGVNESDLETIIDIIVIHLDWLAKENNYSKHTNHGWFQSWHVFKIYCAWPWLKNSKDRKQQAYSRLKSEIDFAFTSEGVHKENSIGYHLTMIHTLREMIAFCESNTISFPGLNDITYKAVGFLGAMAYFDYSLPLIGDTQFKSKQLKTIQRILNFYSYDNQENEIFDYSSSGYFVQKKVLSVADLPYAQLIIKNSHLSHYHRHDDDLSLYYRLGKNTVFGGSGLYGYDKNNINRVYVRSPYAHTCVFPKGVIQSERNPSNVQQPVLEKPTDGVVKGKTFLYEGMEIVREVSLIDSNGFFYVADYAKSSKPQFMVTNFVLPEVVNAHQISICKGLIKVHLDQRVVFIKFDLELFEEIRIVSGEGEVVSDMAIVSRQINNIDPASRIEFHWRVLGEATEKRLFHIGPSI